jgi:hypothetical protein
VTYREIAAAAERHGIKASDALDLVQTAGGPVTDADAFVADIAAKYPRLGGIREQPQPVASEEQQRYQRGVGIGCVIDQARIQAGLEPLFTAHYADGSAA